MPTNPDLNPRRATEAARAEFEAVHAGSEGEATWTQADPFVDENPLSLSGGANTPHTSDEHPYTPDNPVSALLGGRKPYHPDQEEPLEPGHGPTGYLGHDN